MIEPTQEQQNQICADLARAMGWFGLHWHEQCKSPRWWGLRKGETGQINRLIPNPFKSAEDSRALVEWLATQSAEVQAQFEIYITQALAELPDDLRCVPLYYLTAPLPVIALAVHQALRLDEVKE